jgi:hypothetical protein
MNLTPFFFSFCWYSALLSSASRLSFMTFAAGEMTLTPFLSRPLFRFSLAYHLVDEHPQPEELERR